MDSLATDEYSMEIFHENYIVIVLTVPVDNHHDYCEYCNVETWLRCKVSCHLITTQLVECAPCSRSRALKRDWHMPPLSDLVSASPGISRILPT